MKRIIPATLAATLLLCGFGVSASAEGAPNWRQEYLHFIVDDYNALSTDAREMTTYQVMDVASSGIPFIYVSHGSTAGGGAFCHVDGDRVVTDQRAIVNFEYIPGSDAYFESGGRMGSYFDGVYLLEDDGITQLATGAYGGPYGVPLGGDTDETPVNTYKWNDQPVSREEYQRAYYGLRDKYLTPEDEIVLVEGYGYGGSSYDEIIRWFMEQDAAGTDSTISGLYADIAMDGPVGTQINFDSQNQSFILLLNLWYDWAIAEGTYSVDEDGVITCQPTQYISSCFENKLSPSNNLYAVHFLIDGDKIIPLEEGIGDQYSFTRIGEGFTVAPDSGTATVTGNAVRVRSGPGTEHTILTELNAGDPVTVTGRSGDWYRISCVDAGGALFWGFMHSDYISKD